MTMENKTLTAAELVKETFIYERSDNHIKSVAVILARRFVKEDKNVKADESKGFKKFAADLRAAAKAIGVKAYYTSFIARFEKDENGDWKRDEYGDRIRKNVGGFLLETGAEFNEALARNAADILTELLVNGVNSGALVLEEVKEKAPKVKKPTKTEVEAENARLKAMLAEMEKRIAAIEAAGK